MVIPARIIPARAGFTAAGTPELTRQTDHPRSRGVYRLQGRIPAYAGGSSPLARGLRGDAALAARARRIIPARAGFTRRGVRRDLGRVDHPRSRGVYERLPITCVAAWGSSPLARGLLHRPVPLGWCFRIIPARAGFTSDSPSPALLRGDHPRSRGVYVVTNPEGIRSYGSSPLARGLPPRPAP